MEDILAISTASMEGMGIYSREDIRGSSKIRRPI
jgi:hypothetical protein